MGPPSTTTEGSEGSAAAAGDEWVFAPDERVAGRYRIVRLIARGGMGEVYETEDLLLSQRVALKTVRPRDGGAPSAERLRREAVLARRVTHPNVCRTFEAGTHHRPGGRDQVFLTMELIDGETLAARIRRGGRLGDAEAGTVAAQLIAALAAAHRAGVVHRDFKSANVMLGDGEAGAQRVVVTDFGLAKSAAPDSETITHGESMLGSPAYMSPEQVRGERVTAASDIYSLGIVLYEMVTGTLPFTGETPFMVAGRRLTEKPQPPRERAPDLAPAWDRAILRCLELDPAGRFAHVEEVLAAIRGDEPPVATRRHRWLWAAALAALAGAGIVAGTRLLDGGAPAARSSDGAPKPPAAATPYPEVIRVAVVRPRNSHGREDVGWIGFALMQLVPAELEHIDGVDAVAHHLVAQVERNLRARDGELDAGMLGKLRAALGVDRIITATYTTHDDGGIEAVFTIHDAAGGTRSVTVAGSNRAIADLVLRAAAELAAAIRGSAVPEVIAHTAAPSDPDIARAHFAAEDAITSEDAVRARGLIERAAVGAPDDPFLNMTLSFCAEDQESGRAARERALAAAASLPWEMRAVIEASVWIDRGMLDRALPLYQQLLAASPRNLGYGLQVMSLQYKLGDRAGAEATTGELRRLLPREELSAVDVRDAQRTLQEGDPRTSAMLAERAADVAELQGDRWLAADANARAGMARFHLGDLAAAQEASRESRALNRAATSQDFEKARHAQLAVLLALEAGNLREALELARSFERLGEQSGQRHNQGNGLTLATQVLREQGDPSAVPSARRAIELLTSDGDPALWPHFVLAELALDGGRAAEAEAEAMLAVEILPRYPRETSGIEALRVVAAIQLASGRSPQAVMNAAVARILAAGAGRLDLVWRTAATLALAVAAVDPSQAGATVDRLTTMVDEARRKGFGYQVLLLGLDRLTALRLAASPDEASARAALVADARAQGFERIARAAQLKR